jgi:hypothetical protein
METVRLSFTDFWPTFNKLDNFFIQVLSVKYDVQVVAPEDHPDLLIYSFNGYEFLKYDCLKLYFTGENDVPDFNFCDYAISFHFIDFNHRHLRLPLYAIYPAFKFLRSGKQMKDDGYLDRPFCSMVVSNNWNCDPTRLNFYADLSQYKSVASGGRYANNVGGAVKDKLAFVSQYKFNIAFENSSAVGYTTEKLLDALYASTVPIYWGNPKVDMDVNPKSFINIQDFSSSKKAIEFIKRVDTDDELYMEYINAPALINNPYIHWEEMLLNFLDAIIKDKKRYIVQFGHNGNIIRRNILKERLYGYPTLRNNIDKIERISKIKQSLCKPFRH